MRATLCHALGLCVLILTGGAGSASAAPPAQPSIDQLLNRAQAVLDADDIERLHYVYAWQQDYMLFNYQVDLFTDDPSAFTRYKLGYYVGKAGARRVWEGRFGGFTNHADMPVFGAMIDHHQAQGVIDVAPDGLTAKARFRTSADSFFSDFGQGLAYDNQASGGADQSVWYENDYVKEGGVWKISAVAYCSRIVNPYLVNPRDITPPNDAPPTPVFYPKDPNGPDRQSNYACHSWPHPGISPPLHYPHPVDGEYIHKP